MAVSLPSKLVLLSELVNCERGAKVRFLGCVDEYVVRNASLKLKHNYPPSESPKVANVNVEHVLESVQRTELDVGSWVNVIGYVERRKDAGIFVQAIALWDAGNIDLKTYQAAVQARKEAG
ncbi:hypothetical protein EJ04DRAFT_513616 [Polyplosphaeria fusca]|uniref:CST complex subunit Ten1 n=1 Tax=Polyplosphaeria fusca TaxID=682080 RepID=A0A9P4UY78_9PLEO|nr:hypothetical protein EJ04DRAFT_513616 [Polyplosphaeria fusca]